MIKIQAEHLMEFIEKYVPSVSEMIEISEKNISDQDHNDDYELNFNRYNSLFRFDSILDKLNDGLSLKRDIKKIVVESSGLHSRLNYYQKECKDIIDNHPYGYYFLEIEAHIKSLIEKIESPDDFFYINILELGFKFHEQLDFIEHKRNMHPKGFKKKQVSYDIYRLAAKDISLILWGKTDSQLICIGDICFDLDNEYVDLNIKEMAKVIQGEFHRARDFLIDLGLYAPPFSEDCIFYQRAIRPNKSLEKNESLDGLPLDKPF